MAPVDPAVLNALELPVEPGMLALRLDASTASTPAAMGGSFDGAWWPRSRDIHAELPGLMAVLTRHIGEIDRIGLDADSWDGLGEPLLVDGREVQIDWFPVGEDTVMIGRSDIGYVLMLVIPPEEGFDEAYAAMANATHIGNTETGEQTAVATGPDAPAE